MSEFDDVRPPVSAWDAYAISAPICPDWFQPDMTDPEMRFFTWRWYFANQMMEVREKCV